LRGLGKGSSAITVVNAFATGKGGAIGIDLWTEAKVKITDGEVKGKILVNGLEFNDFRVVNAVLDVMRRYSGIEFGIEFEINSEIPVGKGLKSSSAVANALVEAIARALRLNIPGIKVVKLGVEAAKKAGVTLTGAFDDACASYFGGLCLTDNLRVELLKRIEIDELPVVILVPNETVLTEELKGVDFLKIAPYVEEAFKLAIKGEWKKALVLNGLIYSTFLSYPPEPISKALHLGAVVGLSGKGPSVFAITDEPERIEEVWREFGDVIITSTR